MNTLAITGRLTGQPEVKHFESGAVRASFSLAISEYSRGEEQTSFVPVEVWGQSAEYAGNYVKKGDLVAVTGSLKQERWVDGVSGENRSKLYVKGNRLELMRRVSSGGNGIATEAEEAEF